MRQNILPKISAHKDITAFRDAYHAAIFYGNRNKKRPLNKKDLFVDLEDRIQFLTDVFQLVFNFHKYNNCNPKLRRTV